MFENVLNPNRYHGFSAKAPFFEGWYYKLVSADGQKAVAIIPGVYLAQSQDQSHSFVQVFDSDDAEVRYHRFPYQAFKPSRESFELLIEQNYFSADEVRLDMDDSVGKISASLRFSGLTPWPVRVYSPGAMGWFAWMPFMECYHGVVSMDHTIHGELEVDGQPLDFNGGRGYIEKDWGKQFPSAWIWGQSNHFDRPGVSLMVSVAVIPWLGRSFGGFIIGLLFDGVIHRFATYNRSRIEEIGITDREVRLVVKNPKNRLRIRSTRETGGLLQAPTMAAMDRRIIETLNASFDIQFETLGGDDLYRGTGHHGGLETVGDLDNLIRMILK